MQLKSSDEEEVVQVAPSKSSSSECCPCSKDSSDSGILTDLIGDDGDGDESVQLGKKTNHVVGIKLNKDGQTKEDLEGKPSPFGME